MRNFIELIDLGIPTGIGIYIGCEFMRMFIDLVTDLVLTIVKSREGK